MIIELTQDYLKSRLSYEPETGDFTWIVGTRAGKVTGRSTRKNYGKIWINKKGYFSHRLAWLYVYGQITDCLDHINGLITDNRINNLRQCSKAENNWNVGITRANTSGFKGVSWSKRDSNWRAAISIDNKITYLGAFATAELASAVYQKKAKELRGEFHREKK